MTILRGIRHFIFLGAFLTALATSPSPAHAQFIVDLGPATQAMLNTMFGNQICTAIMGSAACATTLDQKEIGKDANGVPIMSEGGVVTNLKDTVDKLRDSQLDSNSFLAKVQSKLTGTELAHESRIASAGDIVAHKAKMEELSWLNDSDFIAGEVPLCSIASMEQARFLLDVLARQQTIQLDQAAVAKRSGDPAAAGPIGSKGPSFFSLQAVQETNTNGTCNPEGNDKGNQKWCTSAKAAVKGAHAMSTGLMGQTALAQDQNSPTNIKYVAMFLERLFPNYFSPVRPDLLDPLSTQASEVLAQQDAYNAGLSVFQYPFNSMISENTSRSGIESQKYLAAALQRIGVPAEGMDQILGAAGGSGLTKAGAERVIYQAYYSDPKTYTELGTWNPANLLRTIQVTNMQQVTLMYEVREQLKITNAILGALGSMLTRDMYDDIQSKTAAISSR
ncbi:MAG TPA: hypothetical protein VIN59_09545 [Alphaproteobacteria bacterium]